MTAPRRTRPSDSKAAWCVHRSLSARKAPVSSRRTSTCQPAIRAASLPSSGNAASAIRVCQLSVTVIEVLSAQCGSAARLPNGSAGSLRLANRLGLLRFSQPAALSGSPGSNLSGQSPVDHEYGKGRRELSTRAGSPPTRHENIETDWLALEQVAYPCPADGGLRGGECSVRPAQWRRSATSARIMGD